MGVYFAIFIFLPVEMFDNEKWKKPESIKKKLNNLIMVFLHNDNFVLVRYVKISIG